LGVKNWTPKPKSPLANGDLASVRSWAQSSNTKGDLSRAQSMLAELGYVTGPADGMMGPKTREAIRNFQQMAGLSVTGKVDANLLSTLEEYLR
jgi:localization factor PodJL